MEFTLPPKLTQNRWKTNKCELWAPRTQIFEVLSPLLNPPHPTLPTPTHKPLTHTPMAHISRGRHVGDGGGDTGIPAAGKGCDDRGGTERPR